MKRPIPVSGDPRKASPEDYGEWESHHPLIFEYLTASSYEDGSSRTTSTISVFVDTGLIKVALNDRQESTSLYVTGTSVMDALDALEAVLEGGGGDWRQWKGHIKKK